jgi:Uma2 family endonuclease
MGTLMEGWLPRHRVTVHEYHRMAEAGVLAADARVELIEGEIIDMAPIGMSHNSAVDQLAHLLIRALGDLVITRIQGSIRLSQTSEPEPDVAVLKPRTDFYRHELATGADALLIIEVSDSTLRYDRDVKVPLYARHNVPEVWIVDLQRCPVAHVQLTDRRQIHARSRDRSARHDAADLDSQHRDRPIEAPRPVNQARRLPPVRRDLRGAIFAWPVERAFKLSQAAEASRSVESAAAGSRVRSAARSRWHTGSSRVPRRARSRR